MFSYFPSTRILTLFRVPSPPVLFALVSTLLPQASFSHSFQLSFPKPASALVPVLSLHPALLHQHSFPDHVPSGIRSNSRFQSSSRLAFLALVSCSQFRSHSTHSSSFPAPVPVNLKRACPRLIFQDVSLQPSHERTKNFPVSELTF